MNKIMIVITCFLFLTLVSSGCVQQSQVQSDTNSFVGTWESGVVDGLWIHRKTFYADGTFDWRWLYQNTKETYSTTTGTWSADGTSLTVISDHTDRYTYQFFDDDTLQLTWAGGSRIYYRQ